MMKTCNQFDLGRPMELVMVVKKKKVLKFKKGQILDIILQIHHCNHELITHNMSKKIFQVK